MGHQRLFRDPIHGQIRYERVDLSVAPPPADRAGHRLSWVVQRLIDSREFQRLRHIRQNGLTSYVFHGAEHSRFAHSMGVSFLARQMYDAICRNTDSEWDLDCCLRTVSAGLLHDLGHGPFSHTFEEILEEAGVLFNHEVMTTRLILEDSDVNRVLREVDSALPEQIASFIDKKLRRGKPDHWAYKLVSSQLDADRLDYLNRDAASAGLVGHGFDLPRLLDMLEHLDGTRIAVDRRGIAAVEAYLVTLDQMYRAVYFHKAVRAASFVLSSALRRAIELFRSGDKNVFPIDHPLAALVETGSTVELPTYTRLTESHIWVLLDGWQDHPDKVLADLSGRVVKRHLFKTLDVDPTKVKQYTELQNQARELVKSELGTPEAAVHYYVHLDEPERTSYRRYDWRAERPDESIFLTGGGKKPCPIEDDKDNAIVSALRDTRYFHRLILPDFARDRLKSKGASA